MTILVGFREPGESTFRLGIEFRGEDDCARIAPFPVDGPSELSSTLVKELHAGDLNARISARESGAQHRWKNYPPVSDVFLSTPLARPMSILIVAGNFASDEASSLESARPRPRFHAKLASTFATTSEQIVRRRGVEDIECEVELGVVLGCDLFEADLKSALDAILGYTVFCDVTDRSAVQADGSLDALRAKNFPGSSLVGPHLKLHQGKLIDPRSKIYTRMSRRLVQSGRLDQMINDVPQLVCSASVVGLRAGDIIACGSPALTELGREGSGKRCSPGQDVQMGIEGIGTLDFTLPH